ncbi:MULTISPECIES: YraN family protein [unclassified Janthinobacterium]|uniref:YraN family protein n=1 Tax=unclassified Janthinobacterium TaxID=2610881 RepID=UPI0008806AC9|nr:MULTISPECIES: YraN family protein [unclassified Janthinobacterium]SDA69424.1 putative endonuclease [Janthinobacterium sp. 551a]SFB52476.1 putative endonuclease [Janthinobacterium sp. 344]
MPSPSLPTKQERGRQAEDDALAYLLLQGLVLLQRNYLCRGGELDLIMRDGASVVFVEVRLRSSAAYGGALASITPAKQRRMVLAAQTWLLGQKRLPACRFDALCIDGGHISWLKNILDM